MNEKTKDYIKSKFSAIVNKAPLNINHSCKQVLPFNNSSVYLIIVSATLGYLCSKYSVGENINEGIC